MINKKALNSIIFTILLASFNFLFAVDFHVSNHKKIKISYSVDPQDPITKVELYFTMDRGQTWNFYSEDKDLQSPIEFIAAKDGYYGFYLVTHDKTGNHKSLPNINSELESPFLIDTKKPELSLQEPKLGTIWREGDHVNIKWIATDDHFKKNPISIHYSLDGGKEWKDFHKTYPNIGKLDKKITLTNEHVSSHFKLRVGAIDRANNVTLIESSLIQVIGPNDKYGNVYYANPDEMNLSQKYFETATILAGRSEFYESLRYYHKAVDLSPNMAAYHADMALVYEEIGDKNKAQKKFENAVTLAEKNSPNSKEAIKIYISYIIFLHQNKWINQEKLMIDKLFKYDKENETGMWYLAMLYEERKNIEKAKELWEKISIKEKETDGNKWPSRSLWRISALEKLQRYKNIE